MRNNQEMFAAILGKMLETKEIIAAVPRGQEWRVAKDIAAYQQFERMISGQMIELRESRVEFIRNGQRIVAVSEDGVVIFTKLPLQ